MKIKKILSLLFITCLMSCSYNAPDDYEYSQIICVESNGNEIIRCFAHINAFVDKKDWFYAVKNGDEFDYYKLEHVDEEKLIYIKNFKTNNPN